MPPCAFHRGVTCIVFSSALLAAVLLVFSTARVGQLQTPSSFASRIAQLSEPGGYFDTDNLISNEKSYLHVVPALRDAGLTGGALHRRRSGPEFLLHRAGPAVRSRSSSTCAATTCCCTCSSRRCSSCPSTRVEYMSLLFGRSAPALARRMAASRHGSPRGLHRRRAVVARGSRDDSGAGRRDHQDIRRAVVGGRPPDDRPLPSHVHRRRPPAEVRDEGPQAPALLSRRIAICCSKPIARGICGISWLRRTTTSSSGPCSSRI